MMFIKPKERYLNVYLEKIMAYETTNITNVDINTE